VDQQLQSAVTDTYKNLNHDLGLGPWSYPMTRW